MTPGGGQHESRLLGFTCQPVVGCFVVGVLQAPQAVVPSSLRTVLSPLRTYGS